MATNNVQNVNASMLNSASVKTTQEALEERRREEERAKYHRDLQKDSVTVASNRKLSVAGAGEPAKPKIHKTTAHERIQTARDDLRKAFVEAGGKGGKDAEQGLETKAGE